MRTYSTGLNLPLSLYAPVRFRHESPSVYLRTYFMDGPLYKTASLHRYLISISKPKLHSIKVPSSFSRFLIDRYVFCLPFMNLYMTHSLVPSGSIVKYS